MIDLLRHKLIPISFIESNLIAIFLSIIQPPLNSCDNFPRQNAKFEFVQSVRRTVTGLLDTNALC